MFSPQTSPQPTDPRALESVLASQPMQRALSEAAWAARVILSADASLIFIRQAAHALLTARAWSGREASDAGLPLHSAYIQALWASRRSFAWDGAERCEDAHLAALLESMGLSSGLLLPLRVNGEYVGAWLAASAEARTFNENDERILQTLADNIGLTCASMLLVEENLRYQREADALYEISREISQLLDLDRVLKMIVVKTRSLLNAELSYLALADDEARVARVRVTDGTRQSALEHMVLPYGEGVGGWVAAQRTPLLVDNYPADPRPKPPGIAEIAATENIVSIISVPMLTRTGLVGVLFAASRSEAAFKPGQMSLLAALGTHAATAIENARLYEKEKTAAEKLLAASSTHQKLLRLVLDNQGLPSIAATLSGLVRAPVVVEDRHHRVLCSSAAGAVSPAGQPLPNLSFSTADIWQDGEHSQQLHLLQHAHHAVHIPPRPERRVYHPRTITPIVAGMNLLGYISVLELEPFSQQQYAAVEQASIVLALEFLKIEAAQEVEARLAGDLLDDLIFGHAASDPGLLQRASRLGADLRQAQRVLVLDIDHFARLVRRQRWSDVEVLALKRRFLSTVSAAVARDLRGGLSAARSDSVLVLMPSEGQNSLPAAEARARVLQQAVHQALPDLSVSIGIGGQVPQPDQLPRSYQEAMLALRAVSQLGGSGRVAAFEALGVMPLLLHSQDQSALLAFMEAHLGPLARYDAENQAELVKTLHSFLRHNGNMRLAAQDCHVHLNSLKYRLRRIQEISGLYLRDGEQRFRAQLALAIHQAQTLVTGAGSQDLNSGAQDGLQ